MKKTMLNKKTKQRKLKNKKTIINSPNIKKRNNATLLKKK